MELWHEVLLATFIAVLALFLILTKFPIIHQFLIALLFFTIVGVIFFFNKFKEAIGQ